MADAPRHDVTLLLNRIRDGDAAARNEILTVVSDELYQIARHFMHSERRDHTLTPTALAHEAVIRLINDAALEHSENRAHFFGIVARCMRQVLVHHARRRDQKKREGTWERHPFDDVLDHWAARRVDDFPRFDELLDELGAIDERKRIVVELRFVLGMSVKQTAEHLGISERSVELDTRIARGWLGSHLQEE